ncbi:MAG: hypothetical protein LBE60_08135 [Microbacterium sp.]|jgi:hypothetical protein|uniref:hypothetical protein n=1 Tax=Microbacterium sp. TaxID=51671 RepID=UPI00282D394D|nr:hypothetical protein [Microbacterium sp.]MDR2321598.1 hypothetical protein [Microbacterium sp.]
MPDRDPSATSDPAEAGFDDSGSRQRIVRVRGSRRARLTPAPGTHAEPDERDRESGAETKGASGPNDAALRREVPPHY